MAYCTQKGVFRVFLGGVMHTKGCFREFLGGVLHTKGCFRVFLGGVLHTKGCFRVDYRWITAQMYMGVLIVFLCGVSTTSLKETHRIWLQGEVMYFSFESVLIGNMAAGCRNSRSILQPHRDLNAGGYRT